MLTEQTNWQERLVPFTPSFQPYNDAAREILNTVYNECGLPTKGASVKKYKVVISSVLAAMQRATMYEERRLVMILHGNEAYSAYPEVGRLIIKNAIAAMCDADYLIKIEGSGTVQFHNEAGDEPTKDRTYIPTFYDIGERYDNFIPDEHDLFTSAEWQDFARPHVQITVSETPIERYWREVDQLRKQKMTVSACQKRYKQTYAQAVRQSISLHRAWAKEPIRLPLGNGHTYRCYSSATRIYQHGKMNSGGRWYGGWTNVDKHIRKKATIAGKPIATVDITACQPTLLSAMLGIRMNLGGDTWSDVYTIIMGKVQNSGFDLSDPSSRDKVKHVLMELIGSGNGKRNFQSKASKYDYEKGEYAAIVSAARYVVPALEYLEPKKYDGANYLSFHESNITTRVAEELIAKDITAFPMHDAVLVQEEYASLAADVLQEVFTDYVLKHTGGFYIHPSVTIGGINLDKVKREGSFTPKS